MRKPRDILALVERIMMFVCRIVVRSERGARLMSDKLQFVIDLNVTTIRAHKIVTYSKVNDKLKFVGHLKS
jgi:hypothetical protein